MTGRSPLLMETLIGLHRQPDPATLLKYLLDQMASEQGRAVAICHLVDGAGALCLHTAESTGADLLRRLPAVAAQLPYQVPANTGPVLDAVAATADPVLITTSLPDAISALWGTAATREMDTMPVPHTVVTASVIALGRVAGVVVLVVLDPWPVEEAAELGAHAAVALGQLLVSRPLGEAHDHDRRMGLVPLVSLGQIGAREVNRAERYRRPLSVAVLAPVGEGHRAQQERGLATVVAETLRQHDSAAQRAAGEMIVLLPETPSGGAYHFLRRVQKRATHWGPTLQCQTGTAMFPQDGRSWDDLVQAATNRLGQPQIPPVPGGSLRGSLRSAFPTFGDAPLTGRRG